MTKTFNRIVGTLLVAAAVLGLFFSMIGIASIWSYKNSMTTSLLSALDLITASLDTTGQGLVMVQQSFGTLTSSITSVQDTLGTAADTLETTKPLFDSLDSLLSDELPKTIVAVQNSLDTAYDSAKIIDTVLRALTIFNRESYSPNVPLHEALAQISDNLGTLPETLATMDQSLENTSSQTEVIQADLDTMAASIESIQTTMGDYETMLGDFDDSLRVVKKQVNTIKVRLPKLVNAAVWVLTIFLVWMAIAQLGLFTQGWELLNRNKPVEAPPAPPKESAVVEEAEKSE